MIEGADKRAFSPLRAVAWLIVVIALFSIPLFARALYESRAALEEGDAAAARFETRRAVEAYGRALRWRAPFNDAARSAEEKLLTLSKAASGEDRIYALKELRKALFVSRSFYTAGSGEEKRISEINSELTALGARTVSKISVAEPFKLSYQYQIAAQGAFWGWVFSVLGLIYYGMTNEGKFKSRAALRFAGAAVFFFVGWLVALRFA